MWKGGYGEEGKDVVGVEKRLWCGSEGVVWKEGCVGCGVEGRAW